MLNKARILPRLQSLNVFNKIDFIYNKSITFSYISTKICNKTGESSAIYSS